MRAKIFLSLSLLIPFAFVTIYVATTAPELICRDDLCLIKGGLVEHYLKGNLAFTDLWRPYDYSRALGYNLLMLANIKWFSMNSRIFAFMIPVFILASALLVYRVYRKSLTPERSPEFIALTYFALTFILFSVIQWEVLIFGYAFVYQSSLFFFMASFISLDLYLKDGHRKYLFLTLALHAAAILVFNGKLYITYAPALSLTFLCYALIKASELPKKFWLRSFIVAVFLTVIALIYLYKLNQKDYVAEHAFYISEILAHPFKALQFFLASFGASVLSANAFFACDYFSFHKIVFLGSLILFFYGLSVFLFFRSRMYDKTNLPLFLIMQTIFFFGFVMVVRFGLGVDYGMGSRYTYVSVCGLLAIVWIFIFVLTRPVKPKLLLRSTIYAGLVVIFSGLLLSSAIEWQIRPLRKAQLTQLMNIAMKVDTATHDELSLIGILPEHTRESLQILRAYKLNVYREDSSARD